MEQSRSRVVPQPEEEPEKSPFQEWTRRRQGTREADRLGTGTVPRNRSGGERAGHGRPARPGRHRRARRTAHFPALGLWAILGHPSTVPARRVVSASPSEVTQLIQRWQAGEAGALDRLLPLVYADLRAMAARLLGREQRQATLQPTALLHDVFVRMLGSGVDIQDSAHLFNTAGRMMRNVLVDRAREAGAEKRGGDWQRVDLVDALQLPIPERTHLGLLDEAIDELEQIDARLARIVELRYFVGLSVEAIARIMDVDKRTIYRDWAFARAWLSRHMQR